MNKKTYLNAPLSDKILMINVWARQERMDCSFVFKVQLAAFHQIGRQSISFLFWVRPSQDVWRPIQEPRQVQLEVALWSDRKEHMYLESSACAENKTSGTWEVPSYSKIN